MRCWTLDEADWRLLANKTGATRLGFALLLKFFELVNEVLDLAQIEAGRVTISLEPVALADAISDALTLLAPLARELRVSLHADTSALADDGHVLADRQRFGQVLLTDACGTIGSVRHRLTPLFGVAFRVRVWSSSRCPVW